MVACEDICVSWKDIRMTSIEDIGNSGCLGWTTVVVKKRDLWRL